MIAVLTAASVIALAACKDEDAPEKITFVLDWAPNTNHVGLYVAKNLGYYAEEGLEVTFIQPGTTGCSAERTKLRQRDGGGGGHTAQYFGNTCER